MLLGRNYDDLSHFTLVIDQTPEALSSGSIYVEYDFDGNALQPYAHDPSAVLDTITFSVIATESGGAVVFSWTDELHGACGRFIRSLNKVSPDRMGDAVIRFLFTYCENTFFSPTWWRAQSDAHREDIRRRARLGTHFTNMPPVDCLLEDDLRFVGWRPEIVSNIRL
jgi:hypothetical protein